MLFKWIPGDREMGVEMQGSLMPYWKHSIGSYWALHRSARWGLCKRITSHCLHSYPDFIEMCCWQVLLSAFVIKPSL